MSVLVTQPPACQREESFVGRTCIYMGSNDLGYGLICRDDRAEGQHRLALVTQRLDGSVGVYVDVAVGDVALCPIGSRNDRTLREAVRTALGPLLNV